MKNMKRLFKTNNKGVSLVTVVICISFVGILASVIMASSLLNYRMKRTNAYAKDTFYSAEQVLDEINVGLQRCISDSLSEAYLDVMENYNDYDTDTKRVILQTNFYEKMWEKLQQDQGHTTYSIAYLNSFLKDSTIWQTGGTYGAILEGVDATGTSSAVSGPMYTYENGIVLKNLRVYYKDSKGYVSIIQTDIRLTYPGYDFASTTALPEVASYGIVSNDTLTSVSNQNMTWAGNFYADSFVSNEDNKISHTGDGTVIVKHEMTLEQTSFENEAEGVLWAGDIQTKGKGTNLTLNGKTYVADDLNINGLESVITLKGIYNGFGNSVEDSDKSSAILVNGTDAKIDLSGLTDLTVAGHAYVGTKRQNSVDTTNSDYEGLDDNIKTELGLTDETSNNDVFTGEAVSVKSNQMMYLIPPELIWVGQNGTSLFNENPISSDDYNTAMAALTPEQLANCTEVDITTPVSELEAPLAEYIKTDATGKAIPHKVYVETNEGKLVYYYINFKSEEKAKEYFEKYYAGKKATYDRYMAAYIDALTFPTENAVTNVTLAAHGVETSIAEGETTYGMVSANVENASIALSDNNSSYGDRFKGLYTKLTEDFADISTDSVLEWPNEAEPEKKILYDNLIDEDELKYYIHEYTGNPVADTATIQVGGVDKIILTTTNCTIDNASEVQLVIASGNVTLNKNDFKGTIIAGGTVDIEGAVQSITADVVTVNSLLRHYEVIDGKNVMVAQVLRDGRDYIFAVEDEEDEENVIDSMSDLVIYENWKKE